MDSNRLLQFKAIAETESMTKAAEKLYISQPALSKTLHTLEDELNCQLFDRVGRCIRLNRNGRKLLEYAERMDSLLDEIKTEFREKPSSDELTICSVGSFFFPFILHNYYMDNMRPIKLIGVSDEEIPDIFLSGQADIAIADDFFLKPDKESGLECIPLLYEEVLLCVPHDHHLADKRVVTLEEIKGEKLMHTHNKNEANNWLNRMLKMNKIEYDYHQTLDSEAWRRLMQDRAHEIPCYLDITSTYLGTPEAEYVKKGRRFVKVEGKYTDRMIYLWYFKKNYHYLAEFLDSIKDVFR